MGDELPTSAERRRQYFWGLFRGELDEARRRHTGPEESERLDLVEHWVLLLHDALWRLHTLRTMRPAEPVEMFGEPIFAGGTLEDRLRDAIALLNATLVEFDRELSDADFQLLSIHGKLARFGDMSAACYARLCREMAIEHAVVLMGSEKQTSLVDFVGESFAKLPAEFQFIDAMKLPAPLAAVAGASTPPGGDAAGGGQGDSDGKPANELQRGWKLAYFASNYVEGKLGEKCSAEDVWDYWQENGFDSVDRDTKNAAELANYKPPSLGTFKTYLSKGRAWFKDRRNEDRKGRQGRSIVAEDEID